jgi:hypothetical protein
MKTVETKRDYVAEFREAFAAGVEGIVKAAGVYVAAIDDNATNAAILHEAFADIVPASAWGGFEAVGRKWMHPKLLLGGGGRYGGRIKRLPYSTQEAIFDGKRFELLTSTGDTLKVDVRECTPDQVDQLLDGSTVRNLSSQRAWIEARAATPAPQDVEQLPYTIAGGKVTFRRGTVLTKQELKRIIAEM